MLKEDRLYLEKRATEELDQAYKAACPEAVRAHYGLFRLYVEELKDQERNPAPGRDK